ncbi:MAG TPA: xylose isomerase [Kofleriaceae bacterium]|jgi:xylose isomerase|nr:xylose isomerase [Kofleriaceae bacterium]
MTEFFADIPPIRYQGPDAAEPLAFRAYDKDRLVLGKPMAEHLRFAVCYWHTFVWNGFDPFGYDGTFRRPWQAPGDPMAQARAKADAAFGFFTRLGVPYFTFHDRDIAPEAATPRATQHQLQVMLEHVQGLMAQTGIKLLWGTANLFSHRRYMSGAATNPDPEVFAFAAAQVKEALDATHRLGGENYVLWGGREGYETLLNTDLAQELDQLARFLTMVVDHKHKIGFRGALLIEPKPREPTKHQYDFDTATVYGFLRRYGLDQEIKVNIEANHATLAGKSFEHEIATALALGIFGSVDLNRGDPQVGWDTDQFPNNVPELAVAMYHLVRGGGFTTGGLNFDAKVRRQSIDAVDLFHGHIGGMDVAARALLAAERMIQDGRLARAVEDRYAGWRAPLGQGILAGTSSLEALSAHVLGRDADPEPVSGRQEYLENLVNRFC